MPKAPAFICVMFSSAGFDVARRRRLAYALTLAGAILYNNWLLGLWLNPRASLVGATTSELGAADQPWAWLFRLLDVAAAICFLLGVEAIARLGRRQWIRTSLRFGVVVLSVSTIVESIARLDCSSALSNTCAQAERLHAISWQHDFHIAESLLSYCLVAVLPLVALLAIRGRHHTGRLKALSMIMLAYLAAWAVESTIRYHYGATSYGYEQRVFILLFTIWYWQAAATARAVETKP